MLQDIPPRTLREAGRCVLETERLALRKPTLADVNAIARLADDRRALHGLNLPNLWTGTAIPDHRPRMRAGGARPGPGW